MRHLCGALAHELAATARLIPYLSREGLEEVRAWLRHPDTVEAATGSLYVIRVDILDAVCRLLAAASDDPIGAFACYQDVGDVPPEVPDDVSGLTGD